MNITRIMPEQTSSQFDRLFEVLTLDEASRVNQSALDRGWMILPFADRQAELTAHIPAAVLQVEDLTRDMFPHLSEDEFTSFVWFHQIQSDQGFRPGINRSEREVNAQAFLSYMITVKESWKPHLTVQYPLERLRK